MLRFVAQLWDTLDPYRVLSYRRMWLEDTDQQVPAEILAEHGRILGALRGGRLDHALRAARQHRSRSETFLRVLVGNDPPREL